MASDLASTRHPAQSFRFPAPSYKCREDPRLQRPHIPWLHVLVPRRSESASCCRYNLLRHCHSYRVSCSAPGLLHVVLSASCSHPPLFYSRASRTTTPRTHSGNSRSTSGFRALEFPRSATQRAGRLGPEENYISQEAMGPAMFFPCFSRPKRDKLWAL